MKELKSTLVQFNVSFHTKEQLTNLQKLTHAPSKSDAIRRAIEIMDMLVKSVNVGGKIIVEDKNGTQKQIIIMGLE